jgi:uridine kinase
MIILILGTSSSGKTSVVNEFPKNFKRKYEHDTTIPLFKKIKNKYIDLDKAITENLLKTLAEHAKSAKNSVIDDVDQSGKILEYLPANTIKVLLYADLKTMTDNLISRLDTNPRTIFIYKQYAKYYVKSNKKDEKEHVGKVNRKDFIEELKRIKWNFKSEKDLIEFAHKIFADMEINDNNDHYIKIRNNFYDLIINTKNKTPKDIYKEIESIIIN